MSTHGPFWTSNASGRFAGRYPLAVERHVMQQVDHLLPGVTTVTPHARYYTLHALVADEVARKRLPAREALGLLRRAEVILSAVSTDHQDPHPGMSRAHGADAIKPDLEAGFVDVADLSTPGRYAESPRGFWGPYTGSEGLLGLTLAEDGSIQPGDSLDADAVRGGLGDVLTLARRDRIDRKDLGGYRHLCLCEAKNGTDGALLARLLIPEQVKSGQRADHRRQTIRMLLRLLFIRPATTPSTDLWPVLAFSDEAFEDHELQALDATPAWTGVALRGQSVAAWRDLWSWLVREIKGLMLITNLADVLADQLPDESVGDFAAQLPSTTSVGRLLPAELDPDLSTLNDPTRHLARLFLGAHRVGALPEKVAAYFEGADDAKQQLTPSWMQARIRGWADRSLRDFARDLVGLLVDRSQRVALSKSTYRRQEGILGVPTRVYVRDRFVFQDSLEGGGGVSFRWETLTTVLAGLGFVERTPDSLWVVTDKGLAVR